TPSVKTASESLPVEFNLLKTRQSESLPFKISADIETAKDIDLKIEIPPKDFPPVSGQVYRSVKKEHDSGSDKTLRNFPLEGKLKHRGAYKIGEITYTNYICENRQGDWLLVIDNMGNVRIYLGQGSGGSWQVSKSGKFEKIR